MNFKLKILLGLLLFVAFIGTFATGLFHEFEEVHEGFAYATFALAFLHMISFWKIIWVGVR